MMMTRQLRTNQIAAIGLRGCNASSHRFHCVSVGFYRVSTVFFAAARWNDTDDGANASDRDAFCQPKSKTPRRRNDFREAIAEAGPDGGEPGTETR